MPDGDFDVATIGIGENGHLAFNDPPADFLTPAPYLVVRLDERLTERGITVKRYAKPTPSRLVSTDTRQKLLGEVQSAVIGLAD